MHSKPVREGDTLDGSLVIYCRYIGQDIRLTTTDHEIPLNQGTYLYVYASQDPERFSERTQTPLETLLDDPSPGRSIFTRWYVSSSKDEIEKRFPDEDLYTLGSVSDPSNALLKSNEDIKEYFSGYDNAFRIEPGQKPSTTTVKNYTSIEPGRLGEHLRSEYIDAMANSMRMGNVMRFDFLRSELEQFVSGALFADVVRELYGQMSQLGRNQSPELMKSYLTLIDALHTEKYEQIPALKADVDRLKKIKN